MSCGALSVKREGLSLAHGPAAMPTIREVRRFRKLRYMTSPADPIATQSGGAAAPTGPDAELSGVSSSASSSPQKASPRPKRWRAGPIGNMIISLAVLLLPIMAFVALCGPGGQTPTPTHTVHAARTYSAARQQARFSVQSPGDLPRGWHATEATVRSGHAHIVTVRVTYTTPSGGYLQYVQSDVDAASFLRDELHSANFDGTDTVAGREWQRYRTSQDGETALVRTDVGVAPHAQGSTDAAASADSSTVSSGQTPSVTSSSLVIGTASATERTTFIVALH